MNLRREKHFTQPYLAELLGISYMTVRRWETGKSKPNLDQINRIAEVFNVPVQYLMGLHDNTDSNLQEVNAFNSPLTAGVTGKNIIIRDTNSHKEIEIPNNAEGHKLFMQLFSELFSGFGGQSVSNSINGDNNSNNKLGTINS